ncbi:MAG: bifunctional diguanylate cyclase/phosphodiesterase [Coriobacteriia bacterium]|nr:bifunctional diguanylate cyclase/phosphodiesterase [Coriobacteriia bacterium]
MRANRRATSLLAHDGQSLEGADAIGLFAEPQRDAVRGLLESSGEPGGSAVARAAALPEREMLVSASAAGDPSEDVVVLSLVPVADLVKGREISGSASRRDALAILESAVSRAVTPWLMFVDVDRFRSVISQLGHVEAESLLDAIAVRLRDAAGPHGTLVRFGGDEFVAVAACPDGAKTADAVAQRLVQAASEPYTVGAHRVHVTVSVGAAAVEDGPADVSQALSRAEAAARAAKAAGRGRHRLFDPVMAQEEEVAADVAQGLQSAMERGELVLHYQPVIDVRDRAVAGAEALVRWERPGHGLVMPAAFIPIAEKTGLISDIGAWVIHEACKQVREWEQAGIGGLWVSVNVSARQLRSGEVVEHVREAMKGSRVRADRCVLEVTETALVEDPEIASEVLREVRALGVRVALDDFGTGYSSLSRMREMPFDKLKIDRSFLQGIDVHAQDAALVAAMVALAHSFDSNAIAEGVETVDQLSYLKALKCDMVQGFVFSRPVPPDAFKEFVSAGPSWLMA